MGNGVSGISAENCESAANKEKKHKIKERTAGGIQIAVCRDTSACTHRPFGEFRDKVCHPATELINANFEIRLIHQSLTVLKL